METYQIDSDTLPIYREIAKTLKESTIKKGDRFNLANLKIERERIDAKLKAKGYYNFNADFLIFELDTNQYNTKRFDLYLRLKKNVLKKALLAYKLNHVNIFPNYGVHTSKNQADTVTIRNVNIIQDSIFFKPRRLRPYMLIEKGQFYQPENFKITTKRLSSIATYKYVNVQFKEMDSTENDSIGYLNTRVQLSPLNKRALNLELQANTKSSGFTGPALALSYTNRNLFKGGEILKLTGEVGYESQLTNTSDNSGLSSTQLALSAELVFPRLLSPIKFSNPFKYAIPKTKISTGISYLNRSELYSLTSFNAAFGYQWNANDYVYHDINLISTSFVRLSNSTDTFQAILDENTFLESSFEQQLISGLTYNFTYNELNDSNKKVPLFFTANIDVAGNSLNLFSKKNEDKNTILGVEFAQYAKIDVDTRLNFKLGNEQSIVTRLYGGLGYAYGNSDVLPFSKQFFSGGPYSIRAFKTRSIGPGTYSPESDTESSYFDRSGDLKLEANVEYRFPLYSYLKGAVFVDAGNIWLLKDNDDLPNGTFSSNFINQLAIGTGLGLRVDVQSFVIRLDWAAPIHKPLLSEESIYSFDAKNGVLNFAIGYPF